MENTGRPVKGWIQHDFIEQGPDVHFRNMVLNSNGVPHDCFVAGELWNLRATLYCIRLGVQDGWNNPANVIIFILVSYIYRLIIYSTTDSKSNY